MNLKIIGTLDYRGPHTKSDFEDGVLPKEEQYKLYTHSTINY
jgi:hypothetical protein